MPSGSEKIPSRPDRDSSPVARQGPWGRVLAALDDTRNDLPAERWRAIYDAIFPDQDRPSPFRPTIDQLLQEAQDPSEQYLSKVKDLMASDYELSGWAQDDRFLGMVHRCLRHCERALGETGGRYLHSAQTENPSQGGSSSSSCPSGQSGVGSGFFDDAMPIASGHGYPYPDDSDNSVVGASPWVDHQSFD